MPLPSPSRTAGILTAVALVLLACARSGQALDPARSITQYVMEVWDDRAGLPQNSVNAIWRTHDGYLWLGTEAGLVRFDGEDFRVFDRRNTSEFNNDSVTALLEDSQQRLWIGFMGGGAVLRSDGQFRWLALAGRGSYSANSVAEDSDGRVWVSTDGGVNEYQEGRFVDFAHLFAPPPVFVFKIAADPRRGGIWVGGVAGLYHVGGRDSSDPATRVRAVPGNVQCVLADRQGDVWAGTQQGLFHRREGVWTRLGKRDGLPDEYVTALTVDGDDNLWIGTASGLGRWRNGRASSLTVADGLPDGRVNALHVDAERSLWVGTRAGGLIRLMDGPFIAYPGRKGAGSPSAQCVLAARDGTVWIGSSSALSRLKPGGVVESLAPAFARDGVVALHEDAHGQLWVGTSDGLWTVSGNRVRQVRTLPNPVTDIEAHSGSLWLVSALLYRMDLTSGSLERVARPGGGLLVPVCVFTGAEGALYVGTYDGLLRMKDGRWKELTIYSTRDGNSRGVIHDGLADGAGDVWLATRDRGLARLRGESVTLYDTARGLCHDNLYAVVDDGLGHFWMSAARGIFRVEKADLERLDRGEIPRMSCVAFGPTDGVRSSGGLRAGSPRAWRANDGRLWFSTPTGLAVVDPRAMGRRPGPIPLVVEDVVFDHRSMGRPPLPVFGPGRGDLNVRYTALSLVAPERLLFRYRLDGLDSDWVEVGRRREAIYTNLAAGDYTFHLQVRDARGGEWSEPAEPVALSILPHFYAAWWFRGLLGLAVVGVVWGGYVMRLRRLRVRELELARRVEEALAKVHVLHGLMPICAWCKRIRDDLGYWQQLEEYFKGHSDVEFTHGMCPDCQERFRASKGERGPTG